MGLGSKNELTQHNIFCDIIDIYGIGFSCPKYQFYENAIENADGICPSGC